MSFDDVRKETMTYLRPRFATKISALSLPVVPLTSPNRERKQDSFPYVDIKFVEDDAYSAAVSGKLKRYIGFIHADIIAKENTGTRKSSLVADALKQCLDDVQLSLDSGGALVYRTGKITPMGVERGKYRVVVQIPYVRDEVVT